MKNFNLFVQLVKDQFAYGGKKYASSNTKECTDILFDNFGKNWLYGTMSKYCFRYSNLKRERDLLKIACYQYILWLKRGFHLTPYGSKTSLNTTVDIKTKYYDKFISYIYDGFDVVFDNNQLLREVNDIFFKWTALNFEDISQYSIISVFIKIYYIWEQETHCKGQDKDTWNKK